MRALLRRQKPVFVRQHNLVHILWPVNPVVNRDIRTRWQKDILVPVETLARLDVCYLETNPLRQPLETTLATPPPFHTDSRLVDMHSPP